MTEALLAGFAAGVFIGTAIGSTATGWFAAWWLRKRWRK